MNTAPNTCINTIKYAIIINAQNLQMYKGLINRPDYN